MSTKINYLQKFTKNKIVLFAIYINWRGNNKAIKLTIFFASFVIQELSLRKALKYAWGNSGFCEIQCENGNISEGHVRTRPRGMFYNIFVNLSDGTDDKPRKCVRIYSHLWRRRETHMTRSMKNKQTHDHEVRVPCQLFKHFYVSTKINSVLQHL
jgi:hypothetical protein